MSVTTEQAVRSLLADTSEEPPEVRQAALNALVPIGEPGPETANALWKYLILGLLILVGVALGGLLYMIGDSDSGTSPDLALTAFSSLLTGLLGLFIKSPTQK
jgi:drug/metabolite transporter (DMT)-like permease